MKPILAVALTAMTAAPALAHDGAHLHPHGMEGAIALLLAAAALGMLAYLKTR